MLIVEGTDLAGKTTLAKAIVKDLNDLGYGHVYQHLSRLPDSFDRYLGYIALAGAGQVRDRFHLSELAYTDARINCGSLETWKTTAEQYRLLDGMLRQYGSYTVVLTVSHGMLVERFNADGDDMYDVDIITAANDSFIDLSRQQFPSMDSLHVDIDATYHLTRENPYVTQEQRNDIVRDYAHRQQAIEQMLLS